LYAHWYDLISQQNSGNEVTTTLLQPQWNSDYDFNKSESLNFFYKLENSFPQAMQLADQFTLQNHLVFKGNALLQNERYHNANLRYAKTNLYRGITGMPWRLGIKKSKTIRNEIQLWYQPV
jgi:hypothetical protein